MKRRVFLGFPEIGIRKAIGAGRGTIMLQFLIEALLVSMMGCMIGIVFGLYPAGQFVSAGCDKSGEILCTGYPDARSDHVSGAHHQCETIWL